jgi:hypothetical protein
MSGEWSGGKGDARRPCLVSREEEDLRWAVFQGWIKITDDDFNKRITEIRQRTGKP